MQESLRRIPVWVSDNLLLPRCLLEANGTPSWDLLGQQIVGQFADSFTTALNAAIPALVDNLNPIAKAKAVIGAVGDLKNGLQGESSNGQPATGGPSADVSTKPVANSPSNTRPKDADDPAYTQVARDLPFYQLLGGFFIGSDAVQDILRSAILA